MSFAGWIDLGKTPKATRSLAHSSSGHCFACTSWISWEGAWLPTKGLALWTEKLFCPPNKVRWGLGIPILIHGLLCALSHFISLFFFDFVLDFEFCAAAVENEKKGWLIGIGLGYNGRKQGFLEWQWPDHCRGFITGRIDYHNLAARLVLVVPFFLRNIEVYFFLTLSCDFFRCF